MAALLQNASIFRGRKYAKGLQGDRLPLSAVWAGYALLRALLILAQRKNIVIMTPVTIRILVVDDSTIFREGLRPLLEAHHDWEVCGEAVDGIDGIRKNRLLKPHLVIMDLSMPGMSGIEAAAEILKEFPKIPILLLTLYLTPQLTNEARKVGIRATLPKTASDRLVGGIDALLRGEEFNGPIVGQAG